MPARNVDPIAASSSSSALRPIAPQHELRAVLAEGRVVAGEVLATLDGGTLLIGVGALRVPAESRVDLAPGQRFLARVEASDSDLVLHVLAPDEPEAPLVRALREALGYERPAGARIGGLLRALPPGGSELRTLLAEHVLAPGADGSALRALVERDGLSLEHVLASLARPPEAGLARRLAARELSVALLAGLAPEDSEPGLLALLERVLVSWRPRPGEERAAAALLRTLAARPDLPDRARGALRRLGAAAGGELAERSRFALAVLSGEAAEGEVLAYVRAVLVARARADLKARLAASLASSDQGEDGPALAQALRSIEAEQLINLARRESEQGWQAGVPVPDGEGFATAVVRAPFCRVRRDGSRDEGPEADAEAPAGRISLEVDLSRLGPVRADLWLRSGELCLRVTCADETTALVLERELASARPELAPLAEVVRCTVAVDARAGSRSGAEDLRWLADHPLMDLAG